MAEHQAKIEEIKESLRRMNLPNLPPHAVKCSSYRPDLCTRIGHRFTVIEYINTKDRFNWDIGGLCILLLHKDIIEFAVAILSEGVYNEYRALLRKIKRYRNPVLEQLIILSEDELEDWLREKKEQSGLWKPEQLEVEVS